MNTIGLALDMGLDTYNINNQSQFDSSNNKKHGIMSKLSFVPPALMFGGYIAQGILKDSPFALQNPALMKSLKGEKSAFRRLRKTRQYLNSGEYDRAFEHPKGTKAQLKKIAKLKKIATAGKFESVAEHAYMREAAAATFGSLANALNMGFIVAPALFGMTYHGLKGIKKLGYELEGPLAGGHFQLNNMQATDRQRSLMAMHNAEMNGRSAIGQEAFLMHS